MVFTCKIKLINLKIQQHHNGHNSPTDLCFQTAFLGLIAN